LSRKKGDNDQRNGERSLWCAVILNALNDAGGTYIGGSASATVSRLRREARDWLTVPNGDFDAVCHLAGLDPEAAREGAKRALKGRGVGSDFHELLGTGAGSTAQHFSQLEFSE